MEIIYDVIVVGAGHAGCEAAAAAANMGSQVLLITMNLMNMAQMSCNPSIGGIAKGQIVREIDALGGNSAIICDRSTIQFRMLNLSKGPAMWSPRAQNDRILFSMEWRKILEQNLKIDFWQDTVEEILIENNRVVGVQTGMKIKFSSKSVVLANGTFLNGIIHIGENHFSGGRIGERASKGLTENLINLGFESKRMKTGTPVRVDGRSLDFSLMDEQKGDDPPEQFSFIGSMQAMEQKSCYLTYTSLEVHDILRTGFEKSPMYSGRIKGKGPRYCPSIEDKIDRFAEKERHQLFIEPEGRDAIEYYVNGFSSSLPAEVQFSALRKVKGFKHAKFFRPGYAIEYDYFPPFQLKSTLETKRVENLYFAGQINGTTGYEEAAAQGIMAGINAHLKNIGKREFVLGRDQAYIGVLIDDLITKGTDEPYRMFTSRAEYRILLRQDNADIRLTPLSFSLGLASVERMKAVEKKYAAINATIGIIKETSISPEHVNALLEKKGTPVINQKSKVSSILLRPQIHLNDLIENVDTVKKAINKGGRDLLHEEIVEVELLIKYENYIEKEKEIAERQKRLEDYSLNENVDYSKLTSLSMEAREKLSKIRPRTIGQASRISGVSPADISVLIVFLGR